VSDSGLIGSKLGEYEVLRRLGVGAMGAVYEGLQPVIGKRVAIKVLHPHLAHEPEVLRRFESEARAVNRIGHRGIIDIFSFGHLPDGGSYFVMELLEGRSFEQVLQDGGAMPLSSGLRYFSEILDAVGAAHEAGVIHRDLKSSNLFLVEGSRGRSFVKVLDFGIAKLLTLPDLTQARGNTMGTPQYMAPEQVLGKAVSPRTDIYSLGIVLFELLAGKRPFIANDSLAAMRMQVEQKPPLLSTVASHVPPEVDALVDRMLRKTPEERPASCDELYRQMLALLAVYARDAGPADRHRDPPSDVGTADTLVKVGPLEPSPVRAARADLTPSSAAPAEPTRTAPAEGTVTRVEGVRSSGVSQRAAATVPPAEPTAVEQTVILGAARKGPPSVSSPSLVLQQPPRALAPYLVLGLGLLVAGAATVYFAVEATRGPSPIAAVPLADEGRGAAAAAATELPNARHEPPPAPEAPAQTVPPPQAPAPEAWAPKAATGEGDDVHSGDDKAHDSAHDSALAQGRRTAEKRLQTAERELRAREKKAGDRDAILRRFVEQCRTQLRTARSVADLTRLGRSLDELEAQIHGK
jgi:serine/threonine-protein kinase